jgi:hypothetical protein
MDEAPVYLVLGGTGGIGSELTGQLTRGGSKVIAVGRDENRLAELNRSTGAETVVTDATEFDNVENAADRARALWGRLDGIANCVGSVLLRPAHMTSEAAYRETIALNLDTAFGAVRAGGKLLGRGGSVVLVSRPSCAAVSRTTRRSLLPKAALKDWSGQPLPRTGPLESGSTLWLPGSSGLSSPSGSPPTIERRRHPGPCTFSVVSANPQTSHQPSPGCSLLPRVG